MILAHLSDIHVCNNRANTARLFWDFLLISGVPAALAPLVRPILANAGRQRQVLRWLTRRPGAVFNPAALAVSVGVTLPLAVFLTRQFIRFRRIFYIRKDRPELREALVEDVWRMGVQYATITGDLANTADPRELETGADLVAELGGRSRVTVIPGNHDVDIQNRKMRRPARVSAEEKLHLYLEGIFVPKTFPKGIPGTKTHLFPFVRFLKPEVCLIGLDSTTYNPIGNTRGAIDRAQLDRLSEILATPAVRERFKIVALHHHITDMPRTRKFKADNLDRIAGRMDFLVMKKLANADDFLEVLDAGRVDLVLHGHKHVPYSSWVGGTRVLCAGSAAHADLSGKFPPSYNLLRIEGGSIEATRRVWTGEGWVDGDIPEGPRDKP